nr:immunoglobulin light chain junction region [Macaca mulatta]
CQKYSDSPLTF